MKPDESFAYPTTKVTSGDNLTAPIRTGGAFIGSIHTHPANGFPIFSFGDVRLLLKTYHDAQGIGRQREVFVSMVAQNPLQGGEATVYVLKTNNIFALELAIEDELSKFPGFSDDGKERQLHKAQAKRLEKSDYQVEKAFLEQFSNAGISLYKATDDTMTKWTELKLSETDPGTVASIPCN